MSDFQHFRRYMNMERRKEKQTFIHWAQFSGSALVLCTLPVWAQQLQPSQWNPGGSLSVARSAPGGSVIGGVIPAGPKQGIFAVIGGVGASSNPTANVDLIDAFGNVTAGPNLHIPRFGHSVATDSRTVYVSGGITTGSAITSSLETLNAIGLTWINQTLSLDAACPACPSGAAPYYHQMAVSRGAEAVFVGGETATGFSPFIQEPQATYAFTTAATPRVNHTVTTLPDGRVVIIGGSDANGNPLGDIEIYSPVAAFGDVPQYDGDGNVVSIGGGLVSGPSLLHPRAFHTATLLPDGTILVAGGVDSTHQAITSTEIVNLTAGTSTEGPPLLVARAMHIAVPMNSQTNGGIMFIGGMTNGSPEAVPTGTAEVYEPWLQQFRLLGQSLATPRSQFAAANVGVNSIVVAGGLARTGSPLASTEVYPYPTLSSSDIYLNQSFSIAGAGWPAGATINVTVSSPNGSGYSTVLTAVAGASGDFTMSFTPPSGFAEFYFSTNLANGFDDVMVGPYGVHGCTQDGTTCYVFMNGDAFVNGKPGYGTLRDVLSLAADGLQVSLSATVALCSPLVLNRAVTLQGAPSVFQGCVQPDNATVQTRYFIVTGSNVVLNDLTLSHGLAQGVAAVGPNLQAGPGGGAGLGGGMVVSGGSVTLNRITFNTNQAQGGAGGSGTTDDNPPDVIGSNGTPDAAIIPYLPGGFGNGGAAGSYVDGSTSAPGNGNYGGGGGGGGFEDGSSGTGGAYGGNGAGGGTHHGGFLEGDTDYGGGGGGGAGLGGALYVQSGSVTLNSCTFLGNSATGGAGGLTNYNYPNGSPGQGAGNAVFVYGGTVSFDDANTNLSVCGSGAQDICSTGAPSQVQVSLDTAPPGQIFTFTPLSLIATLFSPANSTGSGSIVPVLDGPVDFYDGVTFLGSATPVNGEARLPAIRLPFGMHHIRAVYDNPFAQSASAAKTFLVYPLFSGPAPSVASFATGSLPTSLVTGDFNSDGIPDLAVIADNEIGFPEVFVHLGAGNGTFGAASAAGSLALSGGGLATTDFGFRGAASLGADNTAGLTVFEGNGHGAFPALFTADYAPLESTVVAADFNHDGYPDAASVELGGSPITVMMGNTSHTLSLGSAVANGASYSTIAVADLNGDGNPDLIAGSVLTTPAKVSVLLGNGDGTFRNPVDYTLGTIAGSVNSIAIGDFDGNGIPDIVADSPNGISILLGNGDGSMRPAFSTPFSDALKLAVGDFNGDGHDDVAVADESAKQVAIWLSDWQGGLDFIPFATYSLGATPVSLAVADFNGDGTADIAVTLKETNSIGILLGKSYTPCDVLLQTTPVNVADVQEMLNEVLGVFPPEHDLNGDGTVNVADMQVVARAAMGMSCSPF